jgi:repressor LexA
LTDRQRDILKFIVETIRTRGFPPTLREIGAAFGIRSTKGVNDHLDALERKGTIRRHAELSRGIEVMGQAAPLDVQQIPLLGRIAAGAPLLANENVEHVYSIDRSIGRGGDFMLRVQGDSMVDAHICDGDYIVVRQQDTAQGGDIIAALLDDEATVKRFYREGRFVRLEPENPRMKPIRVDPKESDFRILGRVVAVLRSL